MMLSRNASMTKLRTRLQHLEESLALESCTFGGVIEYDEHTTLEEIEAVKAERLARGARVLVLMPKKGTVPEVLLVLPGKKTIREQGHAKGPS